MNDLELVKIELLKHLKTIDGVTRESAINLVIQIEQTLKPGYFPSCIVKLYGQELKSILLLNYLNEIAFLLMIDKDKRYDLEVIDFDDRIQLTGEYIYCE